MKGFKKDGKFRPTEKRTKSALTKSDLQNFETELDKGEQLLDQRDRLKKQDASSIQHDKLILAQKIKLNKLAKELKLKAREKRSLDDDSKMWLIENVDIVMKKIPEFKKYYETHAPYGVDPSDMRRWEYQEMIYDMPIEVQHKIDDYYYTRVEPFE